MLLVVQPGVIILPAQTLQGMILQVPTVSTPRCTLGFSEPKELLEGSRCRRMLESVAWSSLLIGRDGPHWRPWRNGTRGGILLLPLFFGVLGGTCQHGMDGHATFFF